MKTELENKLNKIADIWNHFILEYKFCSSKIKFNDDIKTNYLGDILGYFGDTFEIIFSKKGLTNYSTKFSFSISFLQAIYIQQDFIQEMLEIFKTGIEKGNLKKDPNYLVNREIRNELIGHPVRKFEGSLVSSTLFTYLANNTEIEYLRYHKDNNFKVEMKVFKIADIQERHSLFLNKYFDTILVKLKAILDAHLVEIERLENVVKNNTFHTVLKLADLYFEPIFNADFIYDKTSLTKVYKRRKEHIRYQNFVDRFYKDLQNSLADVKSSIKRKLDKGHDVKSKPGRLKKPKIKIVFSSPPVHRGPQKVTYHYELGKLATKRNPMDFRFFSGLLKPKCQGNKIVWEELKHMELNIFNEIEYHTSLRLIYSELGEE